ncbi:hypothetical protein ACTMU2_04645 [Cupriavidus basilensis]
MGTAAQLIGKIAQPSAAFDPLKDFAPVSLAYRGCQHADGQHPQSGQVGQ